MKGWSRCCGFVLAGVILAAGAEGQPRFDVASVKPSPPPPGDLLNINLGTASHGVVTLNNTTLSECIRYAWGLQGEEQIDGPGWIRDRQFRYDIVAKAPPATAPDQLLQMMRAMLTERFRLAMHTEPKRIAHLELSVAKGGPKMPQTPGEGPSVRKYYGRGRLEYTNISLPKFAVLLARQLRQPVLDRTGLSGSFDVDLKWTPEDQPPPNAPAGPDDTAYPDVFAAVQQQLGLKLEPSKAPLDVMVVDHAEKTPVEN